MAIIRLRTRKATLFTDLKIGKRGSYGSVRPSNWRLSLNVELADPGQLELATRENPDEIRFFVSIELMTSDLREWLRQESENLYGAITAENLPEDVCGFVQYFDATQNNPATVFFSAYISEEDIVELVAMARHGLVPREVTVETAGFVYDWKLDNLGGGYRWDNAASPKTGIKAFGFSIPVMEQVEPASPSTTDLAAVGKELLRWLKGAVWLLATIAGATVIANWR